MFLFLYLFNCFWMSVRSISKSKWKHWWINHFICSVSDLSHAWFSSFYTYPNLETHSPYFLGVSLQNNYEFYENWWLKIGTSLFTFYLSQGSLICLCSLSKCTLLARFMRHGEKRKWNLTHMRLLKKAINNWLKIKWCLRESER